VLPVASIVLVADFFQQFRIGVSDAPSEIVHGRALVAGS
jgi:hypothetical protein